MLYHIEFKSVFDDGEKEPALLFVEAANIIEAIEVLREEMGPSHALAINLIYIVSEYPVLRKVYEAPATYTIVNEDNDD